MLVSCRKRTFLLLYWFACVCLSKQQKPPSGISAYKPGDVVLGALIPVHLSNGTDACGELYTFGFQLVEDIILTVERINSNRDLLPNVTLGYDIRDYCSDPGLAMKHAYWLLSNTSGPVRAIFGPPMSADAVLVASLLQVFSVPGITMATSDELSGPLYRSFFRSVPPDIQQAKAMADIIEHFNWSYVAAVADDDSYGRNGIAALEKESLKRGSFCLAFAEFVKGFDYHKEIESIIKKIESKRTVRVVILWNEVRVLETVLRQAQKQKIMDRTWFFSDFIGSNVVKMFERYRHTVVGSLGITPSFYRDPYYLSHLRNVTHLTTRDSPNPWWNEVWRSLYGCTSRISGFKEKQCDDGLQLTEEIVTRVLYSSYIPYITDAVMAVAHALHDVYTCKEEGWCGDKKALTSPAQITTQLRKVSFQGLTGRITFDLNGDRTLARYQVINVQSSSQNGSLRITDVGSWRDRVLKLNDSKISWNTNAIPQSVCGNKCPPGMRQTTPVVCCWECVKCPKGSYSSRNGSYNCTECQKGQRSNAEATGCETLPVKNAVWSDAPSVNCSLLATLGILLSALTLWVFVRYRKTPLVKGANYPLSVFLLLLIASCFVLSILYLARPSDAICRLVEFWRSAALTLCVSVLLLKTVRLLCAFEICVVGKTFTKYLHSKLSQIICVGLINAFEICVYIAWFVLDPPYLYQDIRKDENIFFVCHPYKRSIGKVLKIAVVVYHFIVAFLSTYCAIRARNLPENFNEAKYMGFSMYILLLSWLAYLPIHSTLENWYVVIISSATLLLSAYGLLGCMFVPKLYVILLHPERNTREMVKSSISNYTFSNGMVVSAPSTPAMHVVHKTAGNKQASENTK